MVTASERAHFQAIAEAERTSELERIERAARTPPGERILAGFRLARLVEWTPAILAQIDRDADDQQELARRRLALGLGRPPA